MSLQHLFLAGTLWFTHPVASPITTYTWTGNSPTTNNWSDSANWSSGVPVSSDTTAIVFSGSGLQSAATPNSNNDLSPNPFTAASLTFSLSGSDSFSLSGGAITVSTANVSILTLTQSSAGSVSVSNNLTGGYGIWLTGDGTGLLTLTGTLGASQGGLSKFGASAAKLTSNASFYGVTVNGGTLIQTAQMGISRFLNVGSTSATSGLYSLQSGTLSANNGILLSGTGQIEQTGGSNTSSGVSIGSGSSYNFSGGSFTPGSLSVNTGGTFVQSGGSGGASTVIVQSGASFAISGGSTGSASTTVGASTGSPALYRVTGSATASPGNVSLGATGSLEIRSGGSATISSSNFDASSTIFLSDPSAGVSALTVGGLHSVTFPNVIADAIGGPGGITALGQGQIIFHGKNTYTGPTRVSTGLLAGNGQIAGPVYLTNGATVSPGNFLTTACCNLTDAGSLTVGALNMANGTTYTVELSGPAQYDVINVNGAADLSAEPTLSVDLKYTPSPGQIFTILNVGGGTANPIIGQFANAPDGTMVKLNGHFYEVSYHGGDGNELTLIWLDPQITSSRAQGSAGLFDLVLSAIEPATTESRAGGAGKNYSLVFTFLDPLQSVGSVTVPAGTATVSSSGFGAQPQDYVVNLSGVNDVQRVTVALNNVTDTASHTFDSVPVTIRMLIGDANGDGTVNSADAQLVRNLSGQEVTAASCRADANGDGVINSADATLVRAHSGKTVP